jgi:hypothetical protein
MMMEAIRNVSFTRAAPRHIPGDGILHSHHSENPKPCITVHQFYGLLILVFLSMYTSEAGTRYATHMDIPQGGQGLMARCL